MTSAAVFLLAATIGAASTAHAQFTVSVQNSPTGVGRGHVKSFPAGIDCTVYDGGATTGTCSKSYNGGTVVTLVAEADHPDVTFTGYSGAPCSGGGADCVLPALTQNYTVSVAFNPTRTYPLTVTLNGNGYGTVGLLDFRGAPRTGCSIQGTNQAVVCTYNYPVTTVARLEKTAAINLASTGAWSGACTNDPCAITMDGARSVTATFKSPAISVGPGSGSGSGKVTSNIGGMNCTVGPSSATGTCFVTYPSPSQQNVTLSAQASAGSVFTGWTVSDRTCSGTGTCAINGPAFYTPGTVVTAKFEVDQKTLSISGTGSGNIRSTPGDIDCTLTASSPSGRCDTGFNPGTSVTLTATPATGWQFASWGGACSTATSAACTLDMSQNRAVSVTFTRAQMTLTIAGGGNGSGKVISTTPGGLVDCEVNGTNTVGTCSVQAPFETSVTLAATANGANNKFEGWSFASCPGTGSCTVKLTAPQTTVTATFTGIGVAINIVGGGTGDGIVTAPGGMSCKITAGVAASSGCSTIGLVGSSVTLTAVPQNASTFGSWSLASCPATTLTCAVTVPSTASNVDVRFNAPPRAAQLVDALLGGPKLSAAQESELDKFGNKDGTFNLGDLIAQLDRTSETISPAALARLLELERTQPQRPSPRRGVP